jgi:hypothetical protein
MTLIQKENRQKLAVDHAALAGGRRIDRCDYRMTAQSGSVQKPKAGNRLSNTVAKY